MAEQFPTGARAGAGKVSTGVQGLDYILCGGFPIHRLHLIQGQPGVGKTTLGLQYLLAGLLQGESVLYVTLSETEEELQSVAQSHGWSLDGITICDPRREEAEAGPDAHYTIFHPAEIELGETIGSLLEMVDRVKPNRVVIDSLSELKLLARDPLRYRRELLTLKHSLAARPCTALLLDDASDDHSSLQVRTLAHGVVVLEQLAPQFGGERRRLRVVKMRGVKFRGGYHDCALEKEGMIVYPRLVAAEHRHLSENGVARSGLDELDALLGGGLDRGTSTLLMGAAGSGKSALASQYSVAAANRGERVVVYAFDEGLRTLFARSEGLGLNMGALVEQGIIQVQPVDPAELSPGEFAHQLRERVLTDNVRVVVIDSLNGYLNSMPEEKFLCVQLHELLSFLAHHGVITLLVVSQSGLLGNEMTAPVDISYLADTVILLRYFENAGVVRKAVSVVKKRSGNHERTIRELIMAPGGIQVGPPLHDFHGVLAGVATYKPGVPQPHGDS